MSRFAAATMGLMMIAGCSTMPHDSSIDQIMRDYAQPRTPGASVAVVRDGRVVFQKSWGLADVTAQTPATNDSHYRLASVTKAFTAAAILELAGAGKLSLDDSLRKHLPSLPAYADAITIRHLLSHKSGLVDYEDLIPESATTQVKDADVLRLLETQSATYFSPGAEYRYSNSGYALLALIIERVSNKDFATFLREAVFLPASMDTTVAHEEGRSVVPNRAYGHSRDGASWQRNDQSLTSAVLGDGGIYSSVAQLASWLIFLDQGRYAEAMIPRTPTDRANVSYGYGWRISEHDGATLVAHTGETRGFRNAIVRFPERRLGVVVLTNRNEGTPIDHALKIAARFK